MRPPSRGQFRCERRILSDSERESVLDISELSLRLVGELELAPRAKIFARFISELLADSAVNVYTLGSDGENNYWLPKANIGESTVHESQIPAEQGLLGSIVEEGGPLLRLGKQLRREDYAHVDTRRSLVSLAYLPLIAGDQIIGAAEILCFGEPMSEEDLQTLMPAAEVAAASLRSAQTYEEERNTTLSSITRLTQLYDLEKVFSSTLEMDELLPLIGAKFQEILECEAVNIWLVQPDETVKLMHQAGEDPTRHEEQMEKPGDGIAGDLSDDGEPVLIADPSDERLVKRNEGFEEPPVRTLLAVAMMDKGSLVGLVEAINKVDGAPFEEDDLFTLTNLADTASIALHNAGLLLAERKVEILETLVTVSHEITSTLNLERMLQTIVNAPQAVIPYERAAIVLEQNGRFKLSAVTGLTQVNADSPDLAPLNEILQWASLSEEVMDVRQHGEEISSDREETRAKFRRYFEQTGMRGFYVMPLNDDTGRVGMFSLESGDPDFLGQAHIEILQVLAGQATVALRNAQMYKEVPFISVLEPVLVKKRKFMAMEKRRRSVILGGIAAAVLFFAAFPLPLRMDGDAVVAPARKSQIQPEAEGVVDKVFVREGQSVQRGQVLAEMENWNARATLSQAQAKYETALQQMNRALAANDGAEAGMQRVQADYWKAEVQRASDLLDREKLRAPIDGVVATPHVENFAGRKLQVGDTFAEINDTSKAMVDVAIDDADAGSLKAGQKAVVKLNSYPGKTFRGEVAVVSPKAEMVKDTPVFYARVALDNPDGTLRSGMEGRGKVRVGWYPAGYVIFRKPLLWIYGKLWYWFGW